MYLLAKKGRWWRRSISGGAPGREAGARLDRRGRRGSGAPDPRVSSTFDERGRGGPEEVHTGNEGAPNAGD
jgi:hypothetical protein